MNVGEWPTKWAARYPNETCLKYNDLVLTKGEFNLRINRLANTFLAAGIRKGDRVAALMANSNVFLEILFAISKIGGIMVPLNFRLAPPEIEFIMNDSEPEVLIYSPEFLTVVEQLRGKVPSVKQYICEAAGGKDEDNEFEHWIAGQPETEPQVAEKPDLETPHFIMYTSGTTGRPKGAVVRQGQTQWNAINGIHMYVQTPPVVVLCSAPLFHIGALHASATPSVYAGHTLVIQRFFNPEEALKMIEENNVTSMFGIPVMFLLMSQMPQFETTDFSSVQFFIAGGAPCPKPLIDTYMKKGVMFNQGYGMTETATGVTALRTEDALRKLGSCGKPLFHSEVRIVDEKENDLSKGQMGEVLIKSPTVIKEYWNRPKETAASIREGWLYSGDIGYFDDEGYLYLVDRRKDMYISGGENVYPAEVEDVIMGMPQVADCGVIGIPDEKWGEIGLAVIVKAADAEVTREEVIDYCRGKLAGYKRPREVVFTDALPRTLTGKILKKDLRAAYVQNGRFVGR
ncbi:MAG: long-chain fatty acid--CoA ligase [Desulfobacterales bacterium]|nr:long-chain fatty acid--CoA ligase [Desulfobacterales bacterium]MBS3756873.1 long-chain fatty acid--CoA ligase [Desulfobacterales bacterium]